MISDIIRGNPNIQCKKLAVAIKNTFEESFGKEIELNNDEYEIAKKILNIVQGQYK